MSVPFRVISAVLYVLIAPFLGGLLSGIDRVISARMQGRQGPPVLQAFYDVRKLFAKQTVSVNRVQISYFISYMFFVIVTGVLFFADFDLLMVFFVLTTANMFLVISATSVNSPYSNLGAQRELTQMLAYEPMLLITAVGVYMASGSFNFEPGRAPLIVKLPGVFVGFLYVLIIKLRKHPFDLATSHHAHQEVVKGITTELTGKVLGLEEITSWYENVFLCAMLFIFFLTNNPLSIIWSILLVALCYFIILLVDNTNARFKWRLMLRNTWAITLALGAVNLIVLHFMA